MALIDKPERARQLARAIATDLSLYNEEEDDRRAYRTTTSSTRCREEIEEGRALYKSRVTPELYQKNFYDRALIDILIKSKGHVKSRLW